MRAWLVTADDRTGALEVAAEIAATTGPVTVTVDHPPAGAGVVDLASRHLAVDAAAGRAAAAPAARWNAHKIDSTLRGNWVDEVRARARVTGRRVVVVPAWPQMGRTCVGGVVQVGGTAVGDIAEYLPAADLLADASALERWLATERRVGVVDVLDERGMAEVAHTLAGHDVLVVGPAGPIGAAFAAYHLEGRPPAVVRCQLPALVVRGSATDVSRRQMERLAVAQPTADLLEAPPAVGDLLPDVALELAGRARARMAEHHYATVVLIGGDTAAAVLGPAPRLVGGTVAPGLPWSRDARGGGPLVVTKAGGFGTPDSLAALFDPGAISSD
jgi:uncharacterized protein YgbK (DUF1537 family)